MLCNGDTSILQDKENKTDNTVVDLGKGVLKKKREFDIMTLYFGNVKFSKN